MKVNFINVSTSVMGLCIIALSAISIMNGKVDSWWNAMGGILAGAFLIYVKNNNAEETIIAIAKIVAGKKSKKEEEEDA